MIGDDILKIFGFKGNEQLCPKNLLESVANQFHVMKPNLIAIGGEAVVLSGETKSNQDVVLKIAHPRLNNSEGYSFRRSGDYPKSLARFIRGCQIQQGLAEINNEKHIKIPKVYEILEKPHLAVIMEKIPGVILGRYLQEAKNFKVSLHLYRRLLIAIQFLHSNQILHRDIKTDNVIITGSQNEPQICIVDWTQTRPVYSSLTSPGTLIGTMLYMSDKILEEGAQNFTEEDDVYSLGVLLWEFINFQKVPKPTYINSMLKDKALRKQYLESLLLGIPERLHSAFKNATGLAEETKFSSVGALLFEIEKILLDSSFLDDCDLFSFSSEQLKGVIFDLKKKVAELEKRQPQDIVKKLKEQLLCALEESEE